MIQEEMRVDWLENALNRTDKYIYFYTEVYTWVVTCEIGNVWKEVLAIVKSIFEACITMESIRYIS